jgi:hypothetical protein
MATLKFSEVLGPIDQTTASGDGNNISSSFSTNTGAGLLVGPSDVNQTLLGLGQAALGFQIEQNYFGANQSYGAKNVSAGNFEAIKGPASASTAAGAKAFGALGAALMANEAVGDLNQHGWSVPRAGAIAADDVTGIGVSAAASTLTYSGLAAAGVASTGIGAFASRNRRPKYATNAKQLENF